MNLGRRVRDWWLARLQPVDQWTLGQRTIYIVPTRAGLAFGVTLLILLLGSINYQLNLGYALTFLLAGSALASMHMTHGSLRGLTLHLRPTAACHVGGAALLEVVATNAGAARHGLGFSVLPDHVQPTIAWTEIAARAQSVVTVSHEFSHRGHHALPALQVESRFPFGLFRAWSVWRPAGRVWVYPQPESPAPPLPHASPQSDPGQHSRESPAGEFDGVRPWRRSDGPRQVVWKKVAHSGEMVSRDSRESTRQQLWLDWALTPGPTLEQRLARLTAWVLAAEAQGVRWALRLPGTELPPDSGHAHREHALQTLALWQA
ncbi:MAG: DUF58 domain-containing protein [Burkholderiales bacterium]|nr:DUF58 domain-containing protein [Burkholderiales bacterium]